MLSRLYLIYTQALKKFTEIYFRSIQTNKNVLLNSKREATAAGSNIILKDISF